MSIVQEVHSSSWTTREMLQLGPWCRTRAGVKQWMGKDTSMSSEAEYLEALYLLPWPRTSAGMGSARQKVLRDTVYREFLNLPLLVPQGDTDLVQC